MVREANEVGTEPFCRSDDGMRGTVRLDQHGVRLRGWAEYQQNSNAKLSRLKDLPAGRGAREVR